MDHNYHGRPPTRRRALGDGTHRANENPQPQRQGKKDSHERMAPPPKVLPHNESMVPNGTLAVHHEQQSTTPENKRLSAVVAHEPRPHNPKRDSTISNASTNASNTNRRRKTHIGPWQLGRTIGRGGCSRVRLVRHSITGQFGAAKIISKTTAEKVRALSLANLIQSAEQDPTLYPDGKAIPFGLEREICIMKLLDHPNIVRLYDIWENRDELYLIMEYVEGGELFSYIHEQGGLIEIHVVHIFRQIIAALIYCHRISIHHRDLKPENILLDRDTITVKLVDFGMAALQPAGKKLTTPCGSPHYAAPEVIKTTAYDGAKADVWSCGVILYVLLTGTPPFNYSGDDRDLKYLFRAIERGEYVLPDTLSREAADLIKRILIPDPKRRVGLEDIWNHPFLHKYSKELNFVGENTSANHWTGPLPSITSWESLERTTINREILRYLRTLWHSEKEEVIVQRLMSGEANQEKYFYSALEKYQQDQLENYQPSVHHPITHSASDHHHNVRHTPTTEDVEQMPKQKHKRSQSGYSILNNEHMYSKHSFFESLASEVSYDPFHASKQPIVPEEATQNVTVRRKASIDSRNLRPATALGHRTGSSLRIQALRNSKRGSAVSRGSSKQTTPSQRSVNVRSVSRSSLASSHWPSSPPVIARSGGIGRRGVSFSHLHRRHGSTATASTADTGVLAYTPDRYTSVDRRRESVGSNRSSPRSGALQPSPTTRTKTRASATAAVPRLRVRKPESPSKYIQSEARKVSTELEKVMEEAFNRSSMSSSIRTTWNSAYQDVPFSQYDTPPTSFSNRDSGGSTIATPNTKAMLASRPLPPIPKETPNTFLHRKLVETRADIARRLTEDEGNTEHFTEVLEHLDRLIIPPADNKRVVSAPARSPEHPAPLHAIPEEVKVDGEAGFESTYSPHYRAFTDPVRPQARRAVTAQDTIRLVNQSPTRVAPLNIRKRSGASVSSKYTNDVPPSVPWPGPSAQNSIRSYRNVHKDFLAARVNIAPPPPPEKQPMIKKKKSSWFRRNTGETEPQYMHEPHVRTKKSTVLLQIPEAWQGLDDRIKYHPSPTLTSHHEAAKHVSKQSDVSNISEFPMRNNGSAAAKSDSSARKGFLGFFGKKKEEKPKTPMELGLNFSSSSILSNYDRGPESSESVNRNGPPEVQMNWLSRFLHIKPATKTLCFHVGRGKVRQDLVRLLRDWQRFGVRDVAFDRKTNVINARVDKVNHLKIKPVSFVIELFVVLEHGHRANLCLTRFTQTRGAASSFRKVVDIVEDVCRAKTMLVEDPEKQATMMEVLD
ncbi:Non-specific serine/threonine protein kinase [Ascochyta rabiei]|uniref:Non-specific serine/threonine protein kinase n=1 Tax=Didymella rabiei TaxID=5454 RepID=UPI0018FFD421|nr:Non-specific serine/threonine protein kinase [Ascochyta rabiei]UPX16208.1 Non-specific serine/threonine protein kinase [Ascochyta rabiei]